MSRRSLVSANTEKCVKLKSTKSKNRRLIGLTPARSSKLYLFLRRIWTVSRRRCASTTWSKVRTPSASTKRSRPHPISTWWWSTAMDRILLFCSRWGKDCGKLKSASSSGKLSKVWSRFGNCTWFTEIWSLPTSCSTSQITQRWPLWTATKEGSSSLRLIWQKSSSMQRSLTLVSVLS